MSRFKKIILLMSLVLFSAQYIYAQSYNIKTIITNKTELVPSTELTIVKIRVLTLSINNSNDIIFDAFLSDGTKGIILCSNANIKLIAKSVNAQPLNESVFLKVASPAMNDNGEIVICGNLSGKDGIHKLDNNDFIPLALTGDNIHGLKDVTIEKFSCDGGSGSLSINNKGEIAFFGRLSDGRRGLFLLIEGIIEAILLENDPFPVVNGSETLVSAALPTINDKGDVTFRAAYFTDVTKEVITEAIYLFRNGEFVPVKLPGQEAPGTGGRVFWKGELGLPDLGNNSEVLYWAVYMEPGKEMAISTKDGDIGLFLWSNGVTKPLIIEGNQVPGLNNDVFSAANFVTRNTINDSGEIVSAFRSETNSGGIMLFSNNKVVPVVLNNSPPLLGKRFIITSASINNRGNIAFFGKSFLSEADLANSFESSGVFLAVKEDVPFKVTNIKPSTFTIDSALNIKVIGTGFQPGTTVSFREKSIRVLKTNFMTSTSLIATIKITPHTSPGFYDVIVTSPLGETVTLTKGFKVIE